MTDPFDLNRFVDAQAATYDRVIQELRDGQKTDHWMWYVFPQVKGLGWSSTAQHYAIGSREEAVAYSEHPVLGGRLRECTQIVLALRGCSANEIFGGVDALKFRSCMTLFERTAADQAIFQAALDRYYAGEPDPLTLDVLESRFA